MRDRRQPGDSKRALMVAYHFPPEGTSSGVLRTLKFCKYLPAYGWTPHVLTLRERAYPVTDNRLLAQVPANAVIHRTRGGDVAKMIGVRGRYPGVFAVPDRHANWFPFGVITGLRAIRSQRLTALFSTSPHPTAHLIAATLRRLTHIPWVADFRDPWIEEGLYPRPGSLRCRVESHLERLVVNTADRITVTTPPFRHDLLQRYPGLSPSKVHVLFNGYDEDDFAGLKTEARTDRLEILHAGGVAPDFRDPSPLLRAVASLMHE